MYLSIIIPLYNEAPVIARTLDRITATAMPYFVKRVEIIIVNDCSTDGSGKVLNDYQPSDHRIHIITLNENTGKGGAVIEGIRAATGDTILIQDADMELDPADIPGLLNKIHNDDLDLVSGTRFRNLAGYPLFALPGILANVIFSKIASFIVLKKVTDLTCGYKVFRKSLTGKVSLTEKRFGFETELMMKSLTDRSVRYGEQSVSYFPRSKREGKKIRISDGLSIFYKIMRYGTERRKILSILSITLIAVVMLWNMISVRHWKEEQRVIEWDAISYYAYLPAAFVHHDLSLDFIDNYKGPHKFIIWPEKSPTGKYVIKTTMGMSILWLPFFGAGHLIAMAAGEDTGGYSWPYKLMLQLSTLTYLIIGLIYLRKILLLYFSDGVATLTLTGFAFATNIYWYSLFQATMPHVPGFALITAFTWYSIQWHSIRKKPGYENGNLSTGYEAWSIIRLGLLLGLISLIRPTNLIIVLVLLLYGISTVGDLRKRVLRLVRGYRLLLLMGIAVAVVWIPQMIYWKVMTGQCLYFSYGSGERFFFNHPVILRGLFGFRKGLFIYTPLMIFAFAGIFSLWRSHSPLALAITVFVPLNIYIILSWWCWWYGGGFGQRAFIDSYALMAVSSGALLQYAFSRRRIIVRAVIFSVFLLLVSLGIFNNIQYYYGAIHWESMTKEAYSDSFGRIRPSEKFNSLLKDPDYEKARKGEDR